jgi:O-antigen biosynthesis protein WbqP
MYQRYVKRLLDIILSLAATILLAIPMGIIALWIKADSPGPVFFRQRRVGKGKTHFNILKFRTMRGDTPHDVPTHLLKNADSYITRSGAFLRKTSLDELPQIYNILAGQMSVIGPRPALYNQYDLIEARYRLAGLKGLPRLIEARDKVHANDIRPGLTGLAQVNGRDELPIDVKARYDGEYAAHLTFWMDLKIFFRSITYVFQHRGVVEGGTGALDQTKTRKSSK